jgi:BlaI family penicillinase repressor
MAHRKPAGPLTPLELEIMQVLWENGPSNVQAVQQALATRRALAYTTVQTMLNLLQRKEKVERRLVDRAYVYSAAVSRERERGRAIGDVLDRFFGGSAESLVLSLLETRQLTRARLARLQKRVAASLEEPDERD